MTSLPFDVTLKGKFRVSRRGVDENKLFVKSTKRSQTRWKFLPRIQTESEECQAGEDEAGAWLLTTDHWRREPLPGRQYPALP